MTAPRSARGFTLVELLVSMVLVILLMLTLVSMTDATGRLWAYTTGQVEQFRDAREAFETITRRLSQATLNTYWDYQYPLKTDGTGTADTTKSPTNYVRQSELRFLSGNAATLIGGAGAANPSMYPGHAVFFQAPLGEVNDAADYSNLNSLLNTWGFFVEYGNDSANQPDFFAGLNPPIPLRNRFRVMELREPSESLTLYAGPPGSPQLGTSGRPGYTGHDWFTYPLLSASPTPVRVLAENILALVILPKLAPSDEQALLNNGTVNGPLGTNLASQYTYDSTATSPTAAINPKNQLPPILQVTMIAVDEPSFKRLQPGATRPSPDPFFTGAGGTPLFTDATKYANDLQSLQNTLAGQNPAYPVKLNYRVFTTNVGLKSAKWSRDQTN